MGRRILEIDENTVKDVINRFLEKHFQKTAIFEPTSVKYVWRVTNSNTPKDYNIWNELNKLIESRNLSEEEQKKIQLKQIDDSPTIFIGRGYITAGLYSDEAAWGLRMLNKNSNSSLFEVDKFEDFWVAYD
jgi:hypothetical protein